MRFLVSICLLFFTMTWIVVAYPVNTKWSRYAIGGYDTVAYFTNNTAIKGTAQFSARYRGATWLFNSETNKQRFLLSPDTYIPAYGGHCAYAMAYSGKLVRVDPKVFTIVDNRLFLNYSARVRETWESMRDNYIRTADSNWERYLSKEGSD